MSPAYKESDDFVPNPVDMKGTFQTTRTGVPQNQDAVSDVFAQDRYAAAQRAKAALDGEGGELLFAGDNDSREAQEANVRRAAERTLAEGEPKAGEPTRAQKEAAQENDADLTGATSASEQPDISDAVTQQNTSAANLAAKAVPADASTEETADGGTEAEEEETEETTEAFDPSTKDVGEVNEYLATASDEERERVLTAERAGKNRKTVDGI